MRYLCISVTFLDDLFHGKRDDDQPEWPPSPMRLFQALVAGSRSGCRSATWSEAKAEAYRWLECLDPPRIVAPDARQAAAYTLFVPNNDSDEKPERQDRLARKSVRPHRIVDALASQAAGYTLHYLWKIPDGEWPTARLHADLICREARNLMALGWGIDQAVAIGRVIGTAAVQSLAGRRWRAWDGLFPGVPEVRVPVRGTLADLERAYEAFRTRLSMKQPPNARELRVFGTRTYLPVRILPPRPCAEFEFAEGVAFPPESVAAVASMLRRLAYRSAKEDTHQFPGGADVYVAGHVDEGVNVTPARFSYLPLPSIGHEHADGMIRRVLIAEPFGGDGAHARWAQQRLRNATLQDEDGNERGVLLDPWLRTSRRVVNLFVRESRTWLSLTPVVLPGFDDGKQLKAERLFLKAVAQAGVPIEAVESFTLRKAPFWPGATHPRHYSVPEYMGQFSRWHVAVRFREPIPGPLSLGVGRHVGLGLLASSDDAAQHRHTAEGPARRR